MQQVVVRLALVVWTFLRANWPQILAAWKVVSDYLDKHPNVPADVRSRFEKLRDRLAAAQRQKSEEAQIRAMLEVVTAAATGEGAEGTSRSEYLRRAERLRIALAMAERLIGRDKRRALKRIRAETDELAREAIESLLPGDRDSDASVV